MLVSVIIPIYNAEQHLEKCIESVINQKFNDFELLLINDGSTDSSGKICDNYVKRDHRIKVFHKENGGVSTARNLGIEKARGEWVTFIDADDKIESNYFDIITDVSDADLIVQGFKYFQDGVIIKEYFYRNEKLNLEQFIQNYKLYPDFSSACSKFYKKSIINQYHIKFNNSLKYGEDTLFNLGYLKFCKNIKLLRSTPYLYRLSTTGLTNTKNNLSHDRLFYEESRNKLITFNNDEFYYQSIKTSLTRLLQSLYLDETINSSERRKVLKETIETNYKIIFDIYTNPKIKIFIYIAHFTKAYILLDFVLKKLNRI